jgi:TonB family protein
MGRGSVLLAISIALLLLPSTISSQVPGNAPVGQESPRIKNVSPDEVRKRVTHSVLPVYPELAKQAHITGTVEIDLGISPRGDVANYRVLVGPPLLTDAAVDAIREWKFQPNEVQGEPTWSRTRALVRFNADGTTAVAFAHPLLADSFGDPGAQRNEALEAAIPPIVAPDEEIVMAAKSLQAVGVPALLAKTEAGDGAAQLELALAYNRGYGVKQDFVEARKWSQLAAEEGYARAQDLLGKLYFLGQGVKMDRAEARKWFEKSTEQGFAEGQYDLGTSWWQGNGPSEQIQINQENTEALKAGLAAFILAARQGHPGAMRNLGALSAATSAATPDQLPRAYQWFLSAAQAGDQSSLAQLSQIGKKLTKDQITQAAKEASAWFESEHLDYGVPRDLAFKFDPAETLKTFLFWEPTKSSTGTSIVLREERRVAQGDKTLIGYKFTATGLPAGKDYTLFTWRFGQPQPAATAIGYSVDTFGKIVCASHPFRGAPDRIIDRWCRVNLEDLVLVLTDYRQAATFRVALMSTDETVKTYARVIPFPIEARDKSCHIWVEQTSFDGTLFMIWDEGFEPGEVIRATTTSEGETQSQDNKVSSDGRCALILSPAVKGKDSGTASYTAVGKSCKVSLKFDWGRAAMTIH